MEVVFEFELSVEVENEILEHLMRNDETAKMTLDVFKERMFEDLDKSISQMPHSTIKVNKVYIKEVK